MRCFFVSAFIMVLSAVAFSQEKNCFDKELFPTVPTECGCIIDNSAIQCANSKVAPPFCTKDRISNLIRDNENLALIECEKYRDKSLPDECKASLDFYTSNCLSYAVSNVE